MSSGLGSVLGSLDLTSGGYVMNNLNIFSSAHVKQDDRPDTLSSPIVVTNTKSACGSRFIMGKILIKVPFCLTSKFIKKIRLTFTFL